MVSTKQSYKPVHYISPTEVMPELSKHMLVDGFDFVLDLENSSGANFVEARTGRQYLDFFTCFASMPIGFNHPKMMSREYVEYLGKISLNKPSNSDIYTEAMAAFVKTFFAVANVSKFKYSFFISGGALAVENALKTAFDWKVRQNFRKGHTTEKGHQVIHFQNAFHGRSGYTMSLTNTDPWKTNYYPKFSWPRIINPAVEFPLTQENLDKVIRKEKLAIEQIKKAFADNPDDIAAIIIEPIQGEGGDNHFRPEFMKSLRTLADENDALLIFDEIQTGLGITGKWWAHEHYGVDPDIMTFGKKMQICGIVVGNRIDTEPENVFKVSSRINSTWGGSLVDMVRSTRYLEIIDEEKLVDNTARAGELLISKLHELAAGYEGIISNVRGKGLFCSFDFHDTQMRNNFREKCFEEGLLILPCGPKSIRFRPPLNISDEEILRGMEIISHAVGKVS